MLGWAYSDRLLVVTDHRQQPDGNRPFGDAPTIVEDARIPYPSDWRASADTSDGRTDSGTLGWQR